MKFSFTKNQNRKAGSNLASSLVFGFTLIEMVTVMAIFVIVTGVILANLPGFRSKSSLDLVAQEVAIQIRGAQTYAMSTLVGGLTDTRVFGYGIKVPTSGQNFSLYHFTDKELTVSAETAREAYLLPKNFEFSNSSDVWVKFKRLTGEAKLTSDPTCIKVQTRNSPDQYRWIVVRQSGQIFVAKDTCPAS